MYWLHPEGTAGYFTVKLPSNVTNLSPYSYNPLSTAPASCSRNGNLIWLQIMWLTVLLHPQATPFRDNLTSNHFVYSKNEAAKLPQQQPT